MRFLLLAILVMLQGCQNQLAIQQSQKNGVPASVIPVFFQQAKSVQKSSNSSVHSRSYRIAGQTYDVMRTGKGYKSRGIASWYGTKFHSQRTSSGEHYNMYGMTAAHRTLPLSTYVKVKNLDNGRVAIVKINDRGPFHADRLIDLSYAAAAKLGVFPKGVAHVEIEAITPQSKHHQASFYVQAATYYQSENSARLMRATIMKLTSSPVFVEKYRRRYLVKIGPFANKSQSEALRKRLVSHKIKGFFSMRQS